MSVGGGSLIKRNLLVRRREIVRTSATSGVVGGLYDWTTLLALSSVHLRSCDRPNSLLRIIKQYEIA